jgi:four helix bundle protein
MPKAGWIFHKLSIAQKEFDESLYWLELLKETAYITETEFESISNENIELLSFFTQHYYFI